MTASNTDQIVPSPTGGQGATRDRFPGLDREHPAKEYKLLFFLVGRLPKAAAPARHKQLQWELGKDILPGVVWLERKMLSCVMEFQSLREEVKRGRETVCPTQPALGGKMKKVTVY